MSKIKLLFMDVDGTLTDGKIYMSNNGEAMKTFDVKDGYGIANILPKLGIIPVIISSRESKIVVNRSAELGITEVYQGVSNKLSTLKAVTEKYDCSREALAYIGDDINDMSCIEYCSFTACPSDSHKAVKQYVDYICEKKGGNGAVREVIDYIEEQYEASSDIIHKSKNN
jgi:3-deoxy-D-manno-octulosonate 8-phosphate phosphatase (KDO 8-P phosphatase)